jgi:hypothetical protein
VSLGFGPLGGGTYASVGATSPPSSVVVTSILPRTGHTAGDTMVEIRGSGFRLPPPPPPKGRAPVQAARVRVLFGDVPAERVEVAEDGLLYCWTPTSDPRDMVTTVTANPTTNRLLATAHGIPNGTRCAIRLKPSGTGAPPGGALPAPLDARAPLYVLNAGANDLQVAATRGGSPIELEDAGSGTLELVWYGAVGVTVQNLAEAPAELITDDGPFGIAEGDDLHVLVGDEAHVVTVGAGDVVVTGAATAPELAAILNRLRGARADVVGERVRLRSDARGPSAILTIAGGTAASALGIEGEEASGSATIVPVDEEATLVPNAFTFRRPDLGAECTLATTVRTLLRALKREVIANVHFATDMDYDANTGDLVNTTYLAELPAIVLANLRIPENTDETKTTPRERDGAAPDTFLELKPEDLVDVRFTLIAAAEDPVEQMNLLAAVKGFFKRHGALVVGDEAYDMLFLPNEQVSIAISTDNPNASSATGELVIRAVPVGDLAIEDQLDLPEGVPAGTNLEAVRDIGWVQESETNLGFDS